MRRSTIPTRLVSPYPGVDFLGRVEVFYSGRWGTICDNSFSTPEANVICQALNFTQGALCTVPNARYGRGTGTALAIADLLCLFFCYRSTGTVWLNYLDCSAGDEVLEDCNHRGWGLSYCNHRDDVGVVCRPSGILCNESWHLLSQFHCMDILHLYIRTSRREKPYSVSCRSHFNYRQLDCKFYL